MNIILFDQSTNKNQLLPLTFTRPIGELRIGILTIREKWEKRLNGAVSFLTEDYLSQKYPIQITSDNTFINGSVIANDSLTEEIGNLQLGQCLVKGEEVIAARLNEAAAQNFGNDFGKSLPSIESESEFILISRPWHLFQHNEQAIQDDFDFLTKGRTSQPISATNTVLGTENIFIEEGGKVECSILNATTGPIYIGKGAEIMEGCIVRGGLAMAENSVLKMGAKIYGPTTLGTYSKVGGEVNNSIFTAYSNKGHDGFLGNAVLGEWCNLGADTNNSNLKNNYQPVKLWDYSTKRFAQTGLQFCGLIMGDHSKAGINTMFNTGTVVGVSSNIYGAGFPRNFLPSFVWGGVLGYKTYRFDKAMETAEIMMARRKIELTQVDIDIMKTIFDQSSSFRTWEKE